MSGHPTEQQVTEPQAESGGTGEGRRTRFLRPSFTPGFILKLLFLAAVNGLAIVAFPAMIDQEWWFGIAAVVVTTLAIDYVYLSRRTIPLKYLVPGTIFALVFQVIPVLYSGYIAFTNFGTGNILTQEQAIDNAEARFSSVPESTQFSLTVLAADAGEGELALLLEDGNGDLFLGTEADGLSPVSEDQITRDDNGRVARVDAYTALALRDLADRQDELLGTQIVSDEGLIRPVTVSSAAVYDKLYDYDEATNTLLNLDTGERYTAVEGRWVDANGNVIADLPGWRVLVGFDNFTRIVTSEAIRGPFLRVFVWNYVFALGSVLLTFALGLLLAVALNHPRMRGLRLYRSLLIIPYALPSFMSALIFRGLLNQDFGVINDILGANIPWLNDPTWAKVSVLLVNLWLGFPYMFLISLGALQAIPSELKEAAFVDGATPRQAFRRVVFPLLMVTLAPLLISSFAFNFNNFNIIFLLNNGGPPIAGAQTPAGHTDILISYTFRLAFEGGRGQDFGLASAIAVLIFIMVATISALSFRRTRVLEELN
jgi:arabinogalactan oligomer/maltooligosaccharide transport system permease protein